MIGCPTCDVPLCLIEYERKTIQLCPDCGGALLRADRLDWIREVREVAWTDDELADLQAEVARTDRADDVPCPRCLRHMEKRALRHGEQVFHIDRCADCGYVWLDGGELELVQAWYEAWLDGMTPEQREKLSAAEAALGARLAEGARRARPLSHAEARAVAWGASMENRHIETGWIRALATVATILRTTGPHSLW